MKKNKAPQSPPETSKQFYKWYFGKYGIFMPIRFFCLSGGTIAEFTHRDQGSVKVFTAENINKIEARKVLIQDVYNNLK
jgi:hypothetical protein